MLVKDIMTTKVISVNSQDTLSKALEKMKVNRVHQLVVLDGNNLRGMITLKGILTHEADPSKAKVESFIVSATKLKPDEEAEEAAKKILLSGMRAVPIVDNSVVGVLSETDMLKLADSRYKIEDVMTECECIEKSDTFGKAKRLMLEKNVSRLPVLGNGKLAGVIDTLDLIDIVLRGKQEFPTGGRTKNRGAKEKLNIGATEVSSFMRTPHIVGKDAKLGDVAEILQKKEEVLVEHDGKVYIVTPKDILETMPKKEKGVYVQVTGLYKDSSIPAGTLSRLDNEINDITRKLSRIADVQSLMLNVKKHEKQGTKIKYSFRAQLMTSTGMFVAKSWGWDPMTAVQDLKRNLAKEVEKKYEKVRHHEKEKKSKELLRD